MARVTFVKKARKSIPGTDIKKGDSYYWWKFRFGDRHVSKTPPRRSQLTQSSFYASLWDIEDDLAALTGGDELAADRDDIVNRLRELAEECENNRSNMPDHLQDSDTGTMLEERAEACNNAADELEQLDLDITDKGDDQTDEEFWEEKLGEVQGVSIDAP